ncbi:hypothetical protein DFJ74DRAFT_368124 [Hyaloraphidium curvatum]|nr:hypothetical protein DFJ74DRAFT_368124 [Hyaloraphidium curvatum]
MPKAKDDRAKTLSSISTLLSSILQQCSSDVPPAKAWEQFRDIMKSMDALMDLQDRVAPRDDPSQAPATTDFTLLTSWLADNGVSGLDKVEFAADLDHGNGVVAKQDLEAQETVLSVPAKLMLSTDWASMDTRLQNFLTRLPVVRTLQTFILPIRLLVEAYDAKSFWKPYIAVLPRRVPVPLFWTVDEIELLKGSPTQIRITRDVKSIIRAYISIYNALSAPLPAPAAAQLALQPLQFTWRAFRWAVAISMSRQNDFPLSGDPTRVGLAFMPGLDMFNHSWLPEPVMDHDYAAQTNDVRTSRPYKKGEQVRITYGSRPNDALLMYSGFVDEERPLEATKMPVALPSERNKLNLQREKILQAISLGNGGPMMLDLGLPPYPGKSKTLFTFVRILLADQDGLDRIVDHLEEEPEFASRPYSLGEKLEKQVYNWIRVRAEVSRRAYPTSMEEDIALLKELPAGSIRRNAVLLRLSEKRLLFDAAEVLAGGPPPEAPGDPAKEN